MFKKDDYSPEKFHNEVLGVPYQSATFVLSRDMIEKCCSIYNHDMVPETNLHTYKFYKCDRYMGID